MNASRIGSGGWLGLAFVLVWCTGYIAGKQAVAAAAPFAVLVMRFGATALIFAALAGATRLREVGKRAAWHSAVVGVLMLAMQFGGVYGGFALGAHSGMAALVIGVMPLWVALCSQFDPQARLGGLQWLGMLLGFVGVAVVAVDRVDGSAPWQAWLALLVGLAGISMGTLYQKRHASQLDLRAGLAIQNAAATLVLLPFALCEGIAWPGPAATLSLALGWLVLVNSVGGFALLFLLIRRGAATRVAALFFLMPPVTAVMGWLALGEHLTLRKASGFALAAFGVWLATRRRG